MNDFQAVEPPKKRLSNVISLLIPAKSYRLQCAWTKQKSLPVIEEYACRILLIFGRLLPLEVQNYFGLSSREREVLVENLIKNRLASIDEEGMLVGSPLLTRQNPSNSELISLTEYEERSELVIFELLTHSLMPRKPFDTSRFGLPELDPLSGRDFGKENVISNFGKQYRAFLEFSRQNRHEARTTRLYKVSSCEIEKTLQIPINIDIYVQPSNETEPVVSRDAVEMIGSIRRRALTNELEACITDFLAGLKISNDSLSFKDYCNLVNDGVLSRFVHGEDFDFSGWLHARERKETGYGSQDTTAMLGPIYLINNRTEILELLRASRKYGDATSKRQALWLSSDVPLWGANGELLAEFVRKMEEELAEVRSEKGGVSVLLGFDHKSEIRNLKSKFSNRIPNGIGLKGAAIFSSLELFVIPGELAIAQYHVQPNKESCVTVPIGFITTNGERITHITNMLVKRFSIAESAEILWSKGAATLESLLGVDLKSRIDEYFEPKTGFSKNGLLAGKDVQVKIKPSRKRISLAQKKQEDQ